MFDWIESLADWLVYGILALDASSKAGSALHFFVYDSIKIIFLLLLVTLIMGFVNSYFPIQQLRNFLSRNRLYGLEYLLASVFGAITPFCSCSSVPLFIGFVKGGIPLGVTFAFLITSPLVNEVAIAMFVGMFGWKVTAIYVLAGIFLGSIAGFILGKMKLETELSSWVQDLLKAAEAEENIEEEGLPFVQRLGIIWKEAFAIVKGVLLYVLIGIGIGALLHGFVPTGFFESYIQKDNPFAVPIAVLIGIPLYSNAAGVLPIIQVLVSKGIPLGTALAFMMAVIGLSLPEATLLKKVMNLRLISIFFGVVGLCIITLGYFFNFVF